jgi:hypothetical protein
MNDWCLEKKEEVYFFLFLNMGRMEAKKKVEKQNLAVSRIESCYEALYIL